MNNPELFPYKKTLSAIPAQGVIFCASLSGTIE
jgi:hypothetical protein